MVGRMKISELALPSAMRARSSSTYEIDRTTRALLIGTMPATLCCLTVMLQITSARIVSRVEDKGIADDTPKRARADQGVTLYVALRAGDHWYSDAGTIRIDGTRIEASPIADAPELAIAWRKVEPTEVDTSNEGSGAFRYEPIAYATTPWAKGVTSIAADVHPTMTADHGHGVGTMRYQVQVTQGDRVIVSPGVESRRGRASGGLTDAVHRVSLRRDDSYLGFLTEMFGQPYIWGSAGATDRTHQSERLEGSDCADFVVYGARRMGKHVPYVWTGGLAKYARVLARGEVGSVAFTRPGDLILFPRHVGVLVEDRGTIGVLDDDDIMMHTLFDSPKEQRIGDSGYADKPVQLLRWR